MSDFNTSIIVAVTGSAILLFGIMCWCCVVAYRKKQELSYESRRLPFHNTRGPSNNSLTDTETELSDGVSSILSRDAGGESEIAAPRRAHLSMRAGGLNMEISWGVNNPSASASISVNTYREQQVPADIVSIVENTSRGTPPPPNELHPPQPSNN
ncbi:hypothetical protein QBC41DRAFT_338867 [Cercophora samala]|uniref:Uncharacterized protein n=1 Tax=Cercophora samala TaxID=330535 RepID=A0AA40D801_9PEZI|nr:hypothetical protein QBC41DRAFT_338867 [Cercophora samala]